MLSAALSLVRNELGVRRVFFHTFETGSRLKRMGACAPPRSLYTKLPRRFCFRPTHSGPLFLHEERDRRLRRQLTDPTTRWFVLHV